MKKIIVLLLVMGLLTVAGKAMAADNANLTVTATVQGICGINTAPTINLTLDPTSGAPASNTGDIDFVCTNGTGYVLTVPVGGTMSSLGTPGTPINYDLSATNTVGSGTGASQTSTVTVDIPFANFATALAAIDYTSTVVVSILP